MSRQRLAHHLRYGARACVEWAALALAEGRTISQEEQDAARARDAAHYQSCRRAGTHYLQGLPALTPALAARVRLMAPALAVPARAPAPVVAPLPQP